MKYLSYTKIITIISIFQFETWDCGECHRCLCVSGEVAHEKICNLTPDQCSTVRHSYISHLLNIIMISVNRHHINIYIYMYFDFNSRERY